MGVVIQIRAGGDDPIHEAGLDQRDQARLAEAGGGGRAGEADADEAVVRQHFLREELRRFAQPPAVVSEHDLVNEVGGGNVLAHAERVEARVGGELFGDLVAGGFAHKRGECCASRGKRK